jgi:cellulose synthase/poly-beta-1,6-N-acetylglucosamine synthase-like glycosyltransferase
MDTTGILTWSVALATLGLNASLWLVAIRSFRSWSAWRRRRREPARWPAAHVFVCLKGHLPEIRRTAAALDSQTYPGDYRVTFVTESSTADGDVAASELQAVLPHTRRCDHAVAGRVVDAKVRCAQKNFNLLAGIRHAEASRERIEVYAFCDGDLLPQPGWLTEMVRPIASHDSDATTSLHYAIAADRPLLGALHGLVETLQSWAALVCRGATWGGSTAIRASVFASLDLAAIWSRTCVDDLSMSRALRKSRLRVVPVPQFLVSSRSEIGSYRGFVRWLGRQFFFVKVYLPSRWHLLWMKFTLDVIAIWFAAFHLSHRVLRGEWASGSAAGVAAVLAAAVVLGAFQFFRYVLPERPPFRPWLGATFLAHPAALLACADATLRRKRLAWSDLTYVLEGDGDVVGITGNGKPVEPPVVEEAVV